MFKEILVLLGMVGTLLAYGTTWDETRYVHDPATGLLLKKIYADGHEINYTYTAWGYPKRITYASGKWMERFYNHRLQTVSNVYSSANTPAVFVSPNALGTITRAEDSGGLVAVSIGGSFYFPLYGSNAEILGYVDEGGQVVASYAYGPFGEPAEAAGSMADRFSLRFMTKRWDPFLGLYDFGERWYSVALRRWINRDPLGEDGGVNLYAFCDNDPVNTIDPYGCIPLDTIWDLANVIYDICVGDDVALAADTAALFVPYVPAGATKLVKAARLSKVEKICPGVKKLEVTYKYVHVDYHFTKGPRAAKDWVSMTKGKQKSYWKPQTSDSDVQGYIDAALRKARSEGKVKPSQLKGYEYDVGRPIGATDGRVTSRIKIQIDSNGFIHAHPWP